MLGLKWKWFFDVLGREKKKVKKYWLVSHLIWPESEMGRSQEFAAVIQEFHLSSKAERAPSC